MTEETKKNHKADEIVHISRIQQEILLQLMIKNKAFENIPVYELIEFSRIAITQIRNYEYDFNARDKNVILTDTDFNKIDFVSDVLMAY